MNEEIKQKDGNIDQIMKQIDLDDEIVDEDLDDYIKNLENM